MQELGFNPTRVDKGDPVSVIIGSMGEILKVDLEGRAVGKISFPFPTQPSFGAVSSGRWIGAWVDRGLKKACMGAISLESESGDGRGRDFLRTWNNSASEVLPDSYLWTRNIEGEPMGVSSKSGKVTFGVLNTGIYMVDEDASEIWRVPYPRWPELQEFSNVDSIVDIVHTPEGITIWSESGGISLVSEHDGNTLMSRTLRLPERIIGVRHDVESGWMIMMSGRYAGMMKSLDSEHGRLGTRPPTAAQHRRDQIHVHRPQRLRPQQPLDTCTRWQAPVGSMKAWPPRPRPQTSPRRAAL